LYQLFGDNLEVIFLKFFEIKRLPHVVEVPVPRRVFVPVHVQVLGVYDVPDTARFQVKPV